MSIADLPVFAMLRTRMHWHQERQRLLAENVANADTPAYRPRDLAPPDYSAVAAARAAPVMLARTDPAHLGAGGLAPSGFDPARNTGYSVRPAGNAVSLEEEMLRVSANAMDYQTAASLYSRSLGLIKMAITRR